MAKINIVIDATQEDFSTFADELGYMAEVTDLVDNVLTVTPNPQNKQQFLEAYFKRVVVEELYRRKAAVIDQQTIDTRAAEKEALKSVITSVVGVTSQL